MSDNRAQQIPVTLFRSLTDLARAIEQSQTALSAISISAANDLLAVERIQDIGMALRRRDFEPALCEALEAAAREVGDAIVRNNAASAGTLSTASLLNDLLVPVNSLIALFGSATSPGAELPAAKEVSREDATFDERARADHVEPSPSTASEKTADDETRSEAAAQWFHLTADESATDGDYIGSTRPAPAGSSLGQLPLDSPLPDHEVEASLEEAPSRLVELPPEAPPQITAKPEQAVGTETALPPDILRPTEPATRRAILNDSLADVLSLSEEELIALFS